jgi:hypothetical protein
MQYVPVGKPMGSVVTDDGPSPTLDERFVLDDKAHNSALVFDSLYSQSVLEIWRQRIDKLNFVHPVPSLCNPAKPRTDFNQEKRV